MAKRASLVAVMDKMEWSFSPEGEKTGHLRCGEFEGDATLIREFPDGSTLFRRLPRR